MMGSAEDNLILPAIFAGVAMIFLISIFPFSNTVSIITGVVFSWSGLREDGINDHYALVTSSIYIVTGFAELYTGWFPGDFYEFELLAMISFGTMGLAFVLLQKSLGHSVRGVGFISFVNIVIGVRKLNPIRVFAPTALVPLILINLLFRIFPIPVVSELVVIFSSVTIMAALLSISFSIKAIDRVIQYIYSL